MRVACREAACTGTLVLVPDVRRAARGRAFTFEPPPPCFPSPFFAIPLLMCRADACPVQMMHPTVAAGGVLMLGNSGGGGDGGRGNRASQGGGMNAPALIRKSVAIRAPRALGWGPH